MTHNGRCRRFPCLIRESPAAARREISQSWSSVGGAPPRIARVHGGWPESPPLVQNFSARKWSKRPYGVFKIWRVLPRVFEFKMVFWGLRVSFGIQIYVYIGPRVALRKNMKTTFDTDKKNAAV